MDKIVEKKIEKSSKIGQDNKSLIPTLRFTKTLQSSKILGPELQFYDKLLIAAFFKALQKVWLKAQYR